MARLYRKLVACRTRGVGGTSRRLLVLWGVLVGLNGLGVAIADAGAEVGAANAPLQQARPELIVVIAVDQLRRDRLSPDMLGGLGRLARGGRVFSQAQLDHAISTTCPGHAVLLSGRHPSNLGVPDNAHLDRTSWQQRYCVADAESPSLGGGAGRSPKLITGTMLGDWLRQADPNAKVLSIGAKDRAVVAMAGRMPSAALWFDRELGEFNTSRYYATELPNWASAFNKAPGFMSKLPPRWEHPVGQWRVDDFVGESEDYGRISGHPLGQGTLADRAEQLYASPWMDTVVLDLAETAVRAESLLNNNRVDLLALSLAATDVVGHLYGPYSAEADDALQRLDLRLGLFLNSLLEQVSADKLLVVLSADHGVAPLPEYTAAPNAPVCPVDDGRLSSLRILAGTLWHLYRHFTAPFGAPQKLMAVGGTMLYVTDDPGRLGKHSQAEVIASLETYLENQPFVLEAWTAEELMDATSSEESGQAIAEDMRRLYRNSFASGVSGDLLLQLAPGCQLSSSGTTHGSPYGYDRDIPLLFWGSGIVPGIDARAAVSVDLAPTLAKLLGLSPLVEFDGKVLPLPISGNP